jgi:acyl carrier protein
MVPHHFVELDAFARTTNGKVDVAALPRPARVADNRPPVGTGPDTAANAEPPIDALARDIAAGTLAELLGVAEVDNDTDFFAAGGDSLLAIRAVTAVGAEYGVDLGVIEFFDDPTPRHLAEMVRDARAKVDDEQASLHQVLDGIRSGDGTMVGSP